MIFSSSQFFLFFAGYLFLHVIVPARQRIALIIVGSTFFYGYWNPWYVWLPYLLVAITFFGTLWQQRACDSEARRWRVILVVAAVLTPLVVIKYTNFVYRDVLGLFIGDRGPLVSWAFPLGISFVTFTMIAYVVDVYRGKYPLERNAGLLSGLVLFFPHLIAGPILRPHDLIPQLANPQAAWSGLGIRFVYGLAIFTLGLLKKTVVADTLGEAVRTVYEGPGSGLTATDYLLAWYGFCAQIYCDFSGYTDMAIGVAIVLGVRLPVNFRQPYAAISIIDYWRRWHITLQSWLRDYLYIPLGGNRSGSLLQFRNVMITLGLSGLWHGASWNYVIWGLLHGLAIACDQWIGWTKGWPRVPRWLKIFVTFHFICIAFILFRSPDFSTVARVMSGPFRAPFGNIDAFISVHMFELMLLGAFFATHKWDSHRLVRRGVRRLPAIVLWPVLAVVWIFSITVSQDNSAKFIYFDF